MTTSNTLPAGYQVARVTYIHQTNAKYDLPTGEYLVVPEEFGDTVVGIDNGAAYCKDREEVTESGFEEPNYGVSLVCPKCGQTYHPSGEDKKEEVVWYPKGGLGDSPEEAIAKFEGGVKYLQHYHVVEYGVVASKDMPL